MGPRAFGIRKPYGYGDLVRTFAIPQSVWSGCKVDEPPFFGLANLRAIRVLLRLYRFPGHTSIFSVVVGLAEHFITQDPSIP